MDGNLQERISARRPTEEGDGFKGARGEDGWMDGVMAWGCLLGLARVGDPIRN